LVALHPDAERIDCVVFLLAGPRVAPHRHFRRVSDDVAQVAKRLDLVGKTGAEMT